MRRGWVSWGGVERLWRLCRDEKIDGETTGLQQYLIIFPSLSSGKRWDKHRERLHITPGNLLVPTI